MLWFEGDCVYALDNNDGRPACCHDGGEVSGHPWQQRRDWNEVLPNGNRMLLKVEDSVLDAGSVFKDDVR